MAGVIGIGGIFLKFKNPKEMRTWYQDVLKMNTNDYGVLFGFNHDTNSVGYLQLGTFEANTDYFGNSSQQSMINFRVDDLEKFKIELIDKGTVILDEIESYSYGKFLHIEDPEGNKIELWEPIDEEFTNDSDNKMSMR